MAAAGIGTATAASILVPNGSFEAPDIVFASPLIDAWTQTPANTPEVVLSGTFDNTPAGNEDHIDNTDGSQVGFIFAVPGASLNQDLTAPDAKFEIGMAYTLTAGFVAGGGGMAEGTIIRLALYYRNASNAITIIAENPVAYTIASFPNRTHLFDYSVTTPVVQADDPWAGKAIGIAILAGTSPTAGYWDVDNVRLVSTVPEPTSALMLASAMGLLLTRRSRWGN